MALKQITVPITNVTSDCTQYFQVQYKLTTEANYTLAPPAYLNEINNTITISLLVDGAMYDVRIIRFCCNGSQSAPLDLVVDTTTDSPALAQPTSYTLDPNANPQELDANCDDVTNAEEYVWQVAKDSAFTIEMQEVTTTPGTASNYTFTELETGITYYGRVKARASGYADSPWSTADTGIPI